MERVISLKEASRHRIEKYRFKTLESEEKELPEESGVQPYRFPELRDEAVGSEKKASKENAMSVIEAEEHTPTCTTSEPDPAFEEMLKRVDELSSELVKTQMQLEKAEMTCQERMTEAKEEGFNEGLNAGKNECDSRLESELEEIRRRLQSSIEALEESRKIFLQKVETVEEDLIETALDLAREVIIKEISKDSKEIALRLARLLLVEVKDAAKITLRVNPSDYDYLKKELKEREGFELTADSAVGPGGVVIVSDMGEIDGEIMHRFERIKEAVFGTA